MIWGAIGKGLKCALWCWLSTGQWWSRSVNISKGRRQVGRSLGSRLPPKSRWVGQASTVGRQRVAQFGLWQRLEGCSTICGCFSQHFFFSSSRDICYKRWALSVRRQRLQKSEGEERWGLLRRWGNLHGSAQIELLADQSAQRYPHLWAGVCIRRNSHVHPRLECIQHMHRYFSLFFFLLPSLNGS